MNISRLLYLPMLLVGDGLVSAALSLPGVYLLLNGAAADMRQLARWSDEVEPNNLLERCAAAGDGLAGEVP